MGKRTTLLHGAKDHLGQAFKIIDQLVDEEGNEHLEDTLYEIENAMDGIAIELGRLKSDE